MGTPVHMLCTNSDTHFQKKQVIQTLLDRGMISIEAFDVGNDMVFVFFNNFALVPCPQAPSQAEHASSQATEDQSSSQG